ncbi:MBL fold metallo-hydrolase [Streptomyces rapamycinicus]|uniref:MBL fold metallo-hydrolase n=1 Tax=Streptomyces rapamycinicus TaxID=1226757 RepID=UPI003B82F235
MRPCRWQRCCAGPGRRRRRRGRLSTTSERAPGRTPAPGPLPGRPRAARRSRLGSHHAVDTRHTPGHLCFWEPRHRLLLTGDHLLPRPPWDAPAEGRDRRPLGGTIWKPWSRWCGWSRISFCPPTSTAIPTSRPASAKCATTTRRARSGGFGAA